MYQLFKTAVTRHAKPLIEAEVASRLRVLEDEMKRRIAAEVGKLDERIHQLDATVQQMSTFVASRRKAAKAAPVAEAPSDISTPPPLST